MGGSKQPLGGRGTVHRARAGQVAIWGCVLPCCINMFHWFVLTEQLYYAMVVVSYGEGAAIECCCFSTKH